jgi:Fic family protein
MNAQLKELIEKSKKIVMSDEHQEQQRRSFAYGSAKIENDDITREIIDQAAMRIGSKSDGA